MSAKYLISKPLIPLLPLIISTSLFASDTEKEIELWSGFVDIGLDNLTGNTEEQNITGEIELVRKNKPWTWTSNAELLYTENDNIRTAEKYELSTHLSYHFISDNYVFGRAVYETDKFNGFDYQTNYILGLGWNIYDRETFEWNVELGLGYRSSKVEDTTLGSDRDEMIGTASTTLDWQFSETSSFKQYVSFEVGEEITISYSSSEIKIKMMDNLAFKLAFNMEHTSKVPIGSEKVDTETIASLSYEF